MLYFLKQINWLFTICTLLIMTTPSPVEAKKQKVTVSKEKTKAPSPPAKPHLSIIGPVKLADGIGRHATDLAMGLKDHLSLEIIPTNRLQADFPASLKKVLSERSPPTGSVVLFEDSLFSKQCFRNPAPRDQIRIAYSVFESTKIPASWVKKLNHFFDAVVVADPFLSNVYKDSGVKIPIFVIPLGLHFELFLKEPLKTTKHDPLVFANLGSAHDRKNQVRLIQAFAKVLGNNPQAILKINSRLSESVTREAIEQEIEKQNCSNIVFSKEKLSQEDYLEFFKEVDCFVSLSKGEGFSIQPREAMCLGIPVICTDNTAQSTICKSGLVRSVDSLIRVPACYPCYNPHLGKEDLGFQFDCTIDDAADAMMDVFMNYDHYLGQGKLAREWAAQYAHNHPELMSRYKTLVLPKQIMLGTENTIVNGRLITDSRSLFEKYKRILKI